MSEKRVLRRIFGPEYVEMTEGRRKLFIEQLRNLNCQGNIAGIIKINCDEMSRACSMHGCLKERVRCKVLL
jgi:hypothetical protein